MKIIGAFEYVDFPILGIEKEKAKIDTGAGVCAIHSFMQEIVIKNGETFLCFNVLNPNLVLSTNKFKTVNITNSFGDTEKRYQIPLTIRINSEIYNIDFTLTDRSDMDYKVLIGKNLLDVGNFVIDVKKVTILNESFFDMTICDNCNHKWEKNEYSIQPELCISCGFDNKSGKFYKNQNLKEDVISTALQGGGNYIGQMPSYNAYNNVKWKEFPDEELGIIARRILKDLVKDYNGNLKKALDQLAFSHPDLITYL